MAIQTFGTTTISSGLITAQSGNPSDILYRTQIYFSKRMLEPTQDTLVRAQWAQGVEDLQQNRGSLTMRFFKRRPGSASQVNSLVEGTALATYSEVTIGYVDVTLAQIGEVGRISDLRSMVDVFNALDQNVETFGEDAALKAESVCYTAVVGGMKTWSTALGTNLGFERFAGVAGTGNSAADWATFAALSSENAKMTRARNLGCVTQLKVRKVPAVNGGYVCATPPEVIHDIRQDADWVAAATQSNPQALYKREVLNLDGVRFVETTVYQKENSGGGAYGTDDQTTGDIYCCEYYGRGALGCPKMAKTSDPWAPKIVIIDKPDSANPLLQFIVVGWKALYNGVLLVTSGTAADDAAPWTDVPHAVVLRCKSTFVA